MDDLSAAFFVAGIGVAYGGLMTPFAAQVYGEADIRRRVQTVLAHPWKWRAHNGLFAAGAVLVAAGFATLGGGRWIWAAVAGCVGHLLGAAFAGWRVSVPAPEWFTSPRSNVLFWAYSGVSMAGSGLLGVALVSEAAWMGWLLVAWTVLLVAVVAKWRDLPPFLHYVPLAVVAVARLVA